ncbi:MAG: hypothetical protein KTR14_02740 [Vampirovibrio sp.]|nr:hypothetical protein [Vampirovibrio sp.]
MTPPSVMMFPRITLHCTCGNEFTINVMRFKNRELVCCLICGAIFPEDLGEKFVKALQDMFTVKHELENHDSGFDISFLYKSTFTQPPAPHPFEPEDFPETEHLQQG